MLKVFSQVSQFLHDLVCHLQDVMQVVDYISQPYSSLIMFVSHIIWFKGAVPPHGSLQVG